MRVTLMLATITMGVLSVSKINKNQKVGVEHLKETIEWHSNNRCFYAIKLFIDCNSNFDGIEIILERPVLSLKDKSFILKDREALEQVKERDLKFYDDGSIKIDSLRYKVFEPDLELKNIGSFSVITCRYSLDQNQVQGNLIGINILTEVRPVPYKSASLLLFGEIQYETYILTTPTTVRVGEHPIEKSHLQFVHDLEARALVVNKYELWIAVSGKIESSKIDSIVQPSWNRQFKNPLILESKYDLPELRRGWEVCLKMKNRRRFYNSYSLFKFQHQKSYLIATWIFGALTFIGLVLTIIALL